MHLDNLAEQFYTKQKGQDIFTDRKDKGIYLLLNHIKTSHESVDRIKTEVKLFKSTC